MLFCKGINQLGSLYMYIQENLMAKKNKPTRNDNLMLRSAPLLSSSFNY